MTVVIIREVGWFEASYSAFGNTLLAGVGWGGVLALRSVFVTVKVKNFDQ